MDIRSKPPLFSGQWSAAGSFSERLELGWQRRSTTERLVLLTILFLVGRLGYGVWGVRFDMSPLGTFWQLLDPELLRSDLGRSLFFLHSQPPLFNLAVGLVLKLSPGSAAGVFQIIYLLLGYGCFIGSFTLMRRLGVRVVVALPVAWLLVTRPSFVLLENLLMYDLPVTALLVAAALVLCKATESRLRSAAREEGESKHSMARPSVRRWLALFFWILWALCATRSLFHPVFLWGSVGVLAWLSWFRGGLGRNVGFRCRTVWIAALAPLLLLSLLQLKNWLVFGHGGLSSWLGMNAARIVGSGLSERDVDDLRDHGRLSETFWVTPFSSVSDYPEPLRTVSRLGSSPAGEAAVGHLAVLTATHKSTGATNFNHYAYLAISRQYLTDCLRVVQIRPQAYLRGVAKAWYNFFKPASRIPHVQANREQLGPWVDVFEGLLYGEISAGFRYGGEPRSLFVFPLMLFPAWLMLGFWWALGPSAGLGSGDRVVILWMCATILYVAGVGNSLEVWENQRFRFYVDPYLAVLAALTVERSLRWIAHRRGINGPAGDRA